MREHIRQRALELGLDDCRFATASAPGSSGHFERWIGERRHGEMTWLARNASKRTDPQLVLPGAKSVICLATNYSKDRHEAEDLSSNPKSEIRNRQSGTVARYARYDDYHDVFGERLKSLTQFINELGDASTRSLWYVDTGPVLERDFAQRSGIGFVGKHTNVISRKLGNWIFLAEILTTLELEPDAPEKNRCGSCTRCIEACPTRAITAPFQLDARLCISYLTIELKAAIPVALRPAIGDRIFGCDDCLAVCPWNRFAREGQLMKSHARPELDEPDLIVFLELNEAGFKKKFAGTPIERTKRRGLLRNVCVALGNVGNASALGALDKAKGDAEPLIGEHAAWAIQEIQQRMACGHPARSDSQK
jgi:epoxyqueuosine reductase